MAFRAPLILSTLLVLTSCGPDPQAKTRLENERLRAELERAREFKRAEACAEAESSPSWTQAPPLQEAWQPTPSREPSLTLTSPGTLSVPGVWELDLGSETKDQPLVPLELQLSQDSHGTASLGPAPNHHNAEAQTADRPFKVGDVFERLEYGTETFAQARVRRIDDIGIVIDHSAGISRMEFRHLPVAMRQEHGYSSERDAQLREELTAAKKEGLEERLAWEQEEYKKVVARAERIQERIEASILAPVGASSPFSQTSLSRTSSRRWSSTPYCSSTRYSSNCYPTSGSYTVGVEGRSPVREVRSSVSTPAPNSYRPPTFVPRSAPPSSMPMCPGD